jgi:hypothetical protein
MSEPPRIREELLEPVRRALRWMLSLRDSSGRIMCPDHRIEHTGKSAGAAVMAAILSRLDVSSDGAALRAAAVQQGRRMVANLVREGTSPCHTFRPGRHDPFNCSNSVIDGGACSDALAELVLLLGPELEATDREAFARASLLHARTYLRYAVLDKGIPAQRAWGLTGLAGAHALEADADLERAALEAVGILEGIQNRDGSYPYHPLEWGGEHPGAADVSAFYQSRVTGFLMFALSRLGRDPRAAPFDAPLRRGLEFLLALHGPDGIKCGLVEAKPWYWGATYEVASHPFDVYTLARGWKLFGSARSARAAALALRAWVEHLSADGKPSSHKQAPGRGLSYQCPLFWAAHAEWLARSLPDLEQIFAAGLDRAPASSAGAIDLAVSYFPDAGLGRLEDGRVAAWVRGPRPPFNVHHGSPHGAGLLRVVRKSDGAELLERCRLGGSQEAEWSGASGLPSLPRGLAGGARELRFSLWLARNHWRGRRYSEALRAPWSVAKRGVLAFAAPSVSSAFFLAPQVRVDGDGLELESGLAWRGGKAVAGSRIQRRFQVDGDGLRVTDVLVSGAAARSLSYRIPAAATDVERGPGRVSYRLR